MKEFNLSEKINYMRQDIYVEDVKEFIKRLRDELRKEFWTRKIDNKRSAFWISFIIKQLAGDKLV